MQTTLQEPSINLVNSVRNSQFSLGLATTSKEVEQAQQLRWQVFAGEMGASLNCEVGLDQDVFDGFCDHLIVREVKKNIVVGTYRILSPENARAIGRYYAETEFDLRRLHFLSGRLVEVGRSCVHAEYRTGAVINLLWSGIARYMKVGGYDHLIGCASISLHDGGQSAAHIFHKLAANSLSPEAYRVTPYNRFPFESYAVTQYSNLSLPPLVKGYTRLGAWLCGDPAWDREFNTADLPMLLSLNKIQPRYLRWLFE